MDDALVLIHQLLNSTLMQVLILVVMDDALVQVEGHGFVRCFIVLILVVMDDALVLKVMCEFKFNNPS